MGVADTFGKFATVADLPIDGTSARIVSVHQDCAGSNWADVRPVSLLPAPSERCLYQHEPAGPRVSRKTPRLPWVSPWTCADGRRALIHNVGYLYTARLREIDLKSVIYMEFLYPRFI
jgi:hypothetical protein